MNKQRYAELARKILSENIKFDDRTTAEDELVEIAYSLAQEIELTPEELENLRDIKRTNVGALKVEGDAKVWLRKKLEEVLKELLKTTEKTKTAEVVGDVLEIVETYTARF